MGEKCKTELSKQAAGVLQQLCAYAYDDCVVPSKVTDMETGLRRLSDATSH